jgi:hypothetical protein
VRRSLLLLLVPLTACSGASAPQEVPPPLTTTVAAAPSSPVLATGRPVSPYPATRAGAKAIARGFFEEAGRANVTGDTVRFRQLVEPQCGCTKVATDIEAAKARGVRYEGSHFTIRKVTVVDLRPQIASLEVLYDISRGITVQRDGTRDKHIGRRGARTIVNLDVSRGTWLVISTAAVVLGSEVPW